MVYLQIALDYTSLTKAIETALAIVKYVRDERIWFEAGTPLIKNWGYISVKLLKEATGSFVVADTKTIDAAELEIGEAFANNADAATVLGLSDDYTIQKSIEIARSLKKTIIVDLINVKDPFTRGVEVYEMGADLVYFHIGVDVQKARGVSAVGLLREAYRFKKETGGKFGVAGGIKLESLDTVLQAEPDVIIVGGAITRSEDPARAVLGFLEKIR
ncbi:orotidine 5'-phosphate decarboxylase / HUMPS family protein [Thermogladius sp. 4427co]|uniref:orotidine 5'-phosphate decarboxylase / HUMPS family protein n=1 Tax=Thermogladius sp. 4427co TaxID=3450718 RepID=UPI003F79869C